MCSQKYKEYLKLKKEDIMKEKNYLKKHEDQSTGMELLLKI